MSTHGKQTALASTPEADVSGIISDPEGHGPPQPEARKVTDDGAFSAPEMPVGKLRNFSNKLKLRKAKPAAPVAPSSGPVASGSGTPGRSGSPMPLSPSWHAASTSNVFAEGASGSDAVGVQQSTFSAGRHGPSNFRVTPSHPNNPLKPLAPLLVPFKMIVPSRESAQRFMAKPVGATKSMMNIVRGSTPTGSDMAIVSPPVPRFDGDPPMGYLWLWMGGFMRWRRRFIVVGEAPGVVLIYKRMNMKGKIWSISLCKASVHEDETDARQLKIVTPAGLIFLRTNTEAQRNAWLACLSESIEAYLEKRHLVEGLQEQGLLPGQGSVSINRHMVVAAQKWPRQRRASHASSDAAGATNVEDEANDGYTDEHGAQVNLAHLHVKPEVAEMDPEQRRRIRAHVGERLAQLSPFQLCVEQHLNVLSSQLLGVVSALNVRVGNLTAASGSARLSHVLAAVNSQGTAATGAPPRPRTPDSQAASEAGDAGDVGTAEAGRRGASPPGQRPSGVDSPGPSGSCAGMGRFSRRLATTSTQRPSSLQQAYAHMLEEFRSILHGEAAKIVQLQAENQALLRSRIKLEKANEKARAARRMRSNKDASAAVGTASGVAHDADLSDDLMGGDSDSMVSVMTADEDAFEVDPVFATATGFDMDEESSEVEAPDEEEAEEMRQEEEVLQAIEVVRQVHYVDDNNARNKDINAIVAREAPPPGADPMTAAETSSESDGEGGRVLSRPGSGRTPQVAAARGRRTRMPFPKPLGRGFSVWSILKNMIGKDLTRITMPATINEPLDFLQRLAESFEYVSLVDAAAAAPDSVTRMMLVAVWQLSCYNSQPLREGKPFNPLLGETYEWSTPEGDVRYLCEQVSHHPPVSAYHTAGGIGKPHPWEAQGEFEIKTKFWGKSIELIMDGCESLKLNSRGEEYRWNRATICVNDLIFGNYWAELYGKVWTSAMGTTGQSCMERCGPLQA